MPGSERQGRGFSRCEIFFATPLDQTGLRTNKNYIEAGAPEQRPVDEGERGVLPENDLQLQVSGA
jgi:hypothetical protein